ncbi:citrate synthase [Aspergillus japonicus CBS 114.51]|uniref:Citrate synthase n=1 Tax=Aspergillus japonicus CBS 114.51 TaxID=1448312 RepID=A0A8T8WL07_ASPJA|nr:citrate synthase [Aspergillus japonicus CBS 114.51]RAH76535.1 citrate synthase [Aspergillus japonicus CBS 114.51]
MAAIFDSLIFIVSKGLNTFGLGTPSTGKSDGELTVVDSRTSKSYTIPITDNTVNAIDFRHISTLGLTASPLERYEHGMRIQDPGFRNTIVCESSITYIDGLKGKIQYRDRTLDELMEHNDFEDVAFLLIWGQLPSAAAKESFRLKLAARANPPAGVEETIRSFPRDAPYHLPIIAGLSAWAAANPSTIPIFAGKELYLGKPEAVDEGVLTAFAAIVTVTALTYCHQRDRKFTRPDPNASVVENILRMMGAGIDETTGRPLDKMVRILNKLWIIYADHEMTNSTAAAMHVGSTLADPLATLIAGASAGSGPLHAGAIDLAYKNFQRIGTKANVPQVIEDVKAKKYRLFGYGHRIYKAIDPRVKHLRKMLGELQVDEHTTPELAVAMEIDRIAATDPYFTSRNLNVNADLYGCFVFSAMGFESDIITALMLSARAIGGMAHWREMMGKPANIWRPLQRFTGEVIGP